MTTEQETVQITLTRQQANDLLAAVGNYKKYSAAVEKLARSVGDLEAAKLLTGICRSMDAIAAQLRGGGVMNKSPFHCCIEVVRDDGAFEAHNERVVVLRTVGQFGEEKVFVVYGDGLPGEFKPGDRYELVKREKRESTNA